MGDGRLTDSHDDGESAGAADAARRLRAVLDGVTHYVGLLDPRGVLLETNQASLALIGLRREDVIGRPFWETPWWSHDPGMSRRLRDAIAAARGGEVVRFEAQHAAADGRRVTVAFSLTPVRDEHGAVAHLVPEGRDVTALRDAERWWHETEAHLDRFLDVAADAVVVIDESQQIVRFNKGAAGIFGYRESEVIGQPLLLLLPEAARARHGSHVAAFGRSGDSARYMNRRGRIAGRRRDGEIFPAEVTIAKLDMPGRTLFIAVLRDVSERVRSEQELARAREHTEAILASAAEGIIGLDRDGRVTFANPAALRLLGFEAQALDGRDLHSLVHHTRADGTPYPVEECPTWASVHDGVAARCDDDVYWRADGTAMPVEYTSTPFHLGGRVEGAVLVFRDISERKRTEEALRSMSFTDDLTGVYNRRGFVSLGEQALRQARRSANGCLLLFLDMNDFKSINDTHGHLAGDRALAELAALLREGFRESDLVARLGGDEFVVLAVGAGPETQALHRARLEARIAERNAAGEAEFPISVAIGAAVFDPAAPVSLELLMKQADAALYAHKRERRGSL